jgi:hypothetical protein
MLVEHPMNDRYTRVTAPAGFDGQGTRRDYYFKIRNGAREFRLRIKRWKGVQKSLADTLSSLPTIVTHWERTAIPIKRPLKIEELCKAFVLYGRSKGLDKATLSEVAPKWRTPFRKSWNLRSLNV